MKSLVFCADDFAFNQAVSEGITHLAAAGRISATSVMALSPRWPGDAAMLRALPRAIDVGLHLDITSEFAVDAGYGRSLASAMVQTQLRGLGCMRGASVRTWIEQQLDAFESVWQAPPDHIDGHQHLHQFPGIRQALIAVLQRRYGHASTKPYLRISRSRASSSELKMKVIAWMGASPLTALCTSSGFACAPSLSGSYDFQGNQAGYALRMERWLAEAPSGTLFMCHPAKQALAGDSIGHARCNEFAYLSSGAFALALLNTQSQLVRGSTIYPAPERRPLNGEMPTSD